MRAPSLWAARTVRHRGAPVRWRSRRAGRSRQPPGAGAPDKGAHHPASGSGRRGSVQCPTVAVDGCRERAEGPDRQLGQPVLEPPRVLHVDLHDASTTPPLPLQGSPRGRPCGAPQGPRAAEVLKVRGPTPSSLRADAAPFSAASPRRQRASSAPSTSAAQGAASSALRAPARRRSTPPRTRPAPARAPPRRRRAPRRGRGRARQG